MSSCGCGDSCGSGCGCGGGCSETKKCLVNYGPLIIVGMSKVCPVNAQVGDAVSLMSTLLGASKFTIKADDRNRPFVYFPENTKLPEKLSVHTKLHHKEHCVKYEHVQAFIKHERGINIPDADPVTALVGYKNQNQHGMDIWIESLDGIPYFHVAAASLPQHASKIFSELSANSRMGVRSIRLGSTAKAYKYTSVAERFYESRGITPSVSIKRM